MHIFRKTFIPKAEHKSHQLKNKKIKNRNKTHPNSDQSWFLPAPIFSSNKDARRKNSTSDHRDERESGFKSCYKSSSKKIPLDNCLVATKISNLISWTHTFLYLPHHFCPVLWVISQSAHTIQCHRRNEKIFALIFVFPPSFSGIWLLLVPWHSHQRNWFIPLVDFHIVIN